MSGKPLKPRKPFGDKPKEEIISLGVGKPPVAKCTCGWKTKQTEDLYELGVLAFQHRDATGHRLRTPEDV